MEPPQSRPYNNQDAPALIHQEANGQMPAIHINDAPDGASGKNHASHRGRYKEKYSLTREKYEKALRSQEVYQKQLELANSKIKKLQAENDLLLDVMLVNEESLFSRFFPPNQPSNPPLQRDLRPGPLATQNMPQVPAPNPNHQHQSHQPYHSSNTNTSLVERDPEQRSSGTIRIGPSSSPPTTRRSSRRQPSTAQADPSPIMTTAVHSNNNNNGSSIAQSPVLAGSPYGRYSLAQMNGRDSSPPSQPHSSANHIHLHHPPPPPPSHHNTNGAQSNEQANTTMLPPQGPPYDRQLEFIQHDANGRV